MDLKKVGLLLLALGILMIISFRYIGFVSQTVPSSVTITQIATETPSGESGSSGGGGGGGAISVPRDFSVNPDLFKITLKQGETKREILRIKNTGTQRMEIESIRAEVVDDFMAIGDNSFILESGQTKEVAIDFFAKEDEIPDAYIGSIVVRAGEITKIVNVIVEVKPRSPLFDVTTKLAKTEVIPGENVVGEITIINMGDLEGFDVKLRYAIRDFNGKEIAFREESLAIEKELAIVRQLNVPSSTPPGTYVFYARASYGEAIAAGSESFIVKDVAFAPLVKNKIVWYVLIIIILLLIIFFLLWRRRKEEKKNIIATNRDRSPEIVYVGR